MLSPIVLILATVGFQVPSPLDSAKAAADLRDHREAIRSREADALEKATQASSDQAEAQRLRGLIEPPEPLTGPIRFHPLPEVVQTEPLGLGDRPPLSDSIQAIRDEAAEAYLELARRAAEPEVGSYALADACLREVLRRQPDHAEARRLLGFVPYQGGWATPDAADQLKSGKVLHPKFGWVPESWVAPLDEGLLPGTRFDGPHPSQWLPAKEADALRSDFFQRPWQITTAHFKILTNVPFSEAIQFGRRLEEIHDLFFSLMADLIGRDRLPLAQRFADPNRSPRAADPRDRFEVWYFADKSDYTRYLKTLLGEAEVSEELGRYLPAMQAGRRKVPSRSYFYRDEGGQLDAIATLAHEVSHQLLFESAGRSNFERNAGNFWVWEGLGTYFETVEPQPDGSLLVGGLVGPRIEVARLLIFEGNLFVPINRLSGLSQSAFNDKAPLYTEPREVAGPQGIGKVYLHYNQSMALAIFLMHYDQGRYRPAFLDYIRDAYQGRVNTGPRSLLSYLDVSAETIDQEFLDFLKKTDTDPATSAEPPPS